MSDSGKGASEPVVSGVMVKARKKPRTANQKVIASKLVTVVIVAC